MPLRRGGGDIKFKKSLTRVATIILEKKVKKIRVGWLTIFFKDKGGRLTPPPQLGFTLSQDVIFIHMSILIQHEKNQGSMTVVSIKY